MTGMLVRALQWIWTKCLAVVSAEQGTQVWARSEGRKNSTPWVINTWLKDYTLTSENPGNVRACLQFQHSGGWGREITEFKARLSHIVKLILQTGKVWMDLFQWYTAPLSLHRTLGFGLIASDDTKIQEKGTFFFPPKGRHFAASAFYWKASAIFLPVLLRLTGTKTKGMVARCLGIQRRREYRGRLPNLFWGSVLIWSQRNQG